MPNLKANKGCLVVPLFCLFHFHFSCGNAFYQYDDSGTTLNCNQAEIFINQIYILFTSETCHN